MTTLLAHEWLAPIGGSENVFEQFVSMFPEATKICLWNDAPKRFTPAENVQETWLARTPLRRSKALSLPFHSSAWKSVDLTEVERVLVSSHAFSHHLASRAAESGRQAFAYVHSPARYVWAPEFDQRGQTTIARAGRAYFQRKDRKRVSAAVSYAANSDFVRARIKSAWGVDARVVHPPVDVDRIQAEVDWRTLVADPREITLLQGLPDAFVLGASRLVEYKRLDCAISAGEALDLPVVIVGSGPHEERLRAIASERRVPVIFYGRASDEALYALYAAASLFVFMAIEDFGIMPVEAMSLGTPVLVNEVGGAREAVDLVGGGYTAEPAAASDRVTVSEAAGHRFDPLRAKVLNLDGFRAGIKDWVDA